MQKSSCQNFGAIVTNMKIVKIANSFLSFKLLGNFVYNNLSYFNLHS